MLGTTSVFVAMLYESKRIPHQEEVCWFLNTLDAEYLCHGEIEDINNCLPFKGCIDRLVGHDAVGCPCKEAILQQTRFTRLRVDTKEYS